jgi:subtilisin family serine protease
LAPVVPGRSLESIDGSEGHVLVDNTAAARADGRHEASVTFAADRGAVAVGTWRLYLTGRAARWDAWVVEGAGATRFLDHVAVDDRLALPAASFNAISVGAWTSRNRWTTVDDTVITRNLTVGQPASFSATGPTSDGRFAPDLVAPGEYIAAALSADALPDRPESAFFVGSAAPNFAWADDGVHGLLRGTSQAAPHVAGAAALILQANPQLTAAEVREILRVTARADGLGFSTRLGFGRLDVPAAVRYARGLRGSAVSASRSVVGISRDAIPPGDATTTVTVTPRDDAGAPLGAGRAVEIDADAGQPLTGVVDVGQGRYERTFVAHAPRGAVATVTVRVDGVALSAHPSVYFVRDRSEIGQPFRAGGGCVVGGSSALGEGFALTLALGLVLARRNSRRRAGRPSVEG